MKQVCGDTPALCANVLGGQFDAAGGFRHNANIESAPWLGQFDLPRRNEPSPVLDVIDNIRLLMVSPRFVKQPLKQKRSGRRQSRILLTSTSG